MKIGVVEESNFVSGVVNAAVRTNIIRRKSSNGGIISADLWLIRVDPGGPFKFLAGQYATLGVEHEGQRIERAYSMVSSPYEETLEFFLELVPHGALTPHLFKLNEGDTMLCRKIAKGRFTLDLRSGRTQHLLLSTVTGIAPFVSYVRTLYRDWKNGGTPMPGEHNLVLRAGWQPLVGVWLSGRNGKSGRRSSLVEVCDHRQPSLGRRSVDRRNRQSGRLDPQIYGPVGPGAQKTTAYLCGHPNMVENGRGILQRAGWKKDSMFEEIYFIPSDVKEEHAE